MDTKKKLIKLHYLKMNEIIFFGKRTWYEGDVLFLQIISFAIKYTTPDKLDPTSQI